MPTRINLDLRSSEAEVLINAIDDPQTNLQLTEINIPRSSLARARDVRPLIRLRQAGV